MKKTIVLFVAALVSASAFATAPASVTVSTNSTVLVVAKPINNADAWVTGTAYLQGAVTKNGAYHYMAVDAGTSGATPPTHTTGEVSDGTVTWRQINPNRRNGVSVSIMTTGGKADIAFGNFDAAVDSGLRLTGEGNTIIFSLQDDYQGQINAVSAVGSNIVVGVQEF